MARRAGSTISQDELYSAADEPVRPQLDDARLLDLDADEESPFLRAQKRVSARRGSLPKKTATRLFWGGLALTVALFTCMAVAALYHYGEHSWRFRVQSSDDIAITGLENVTRSQVLDVMGGDIGRNIFFVPLSARQKQLEQIPWVQSASVMRFVPDRLEVVIRERTPVAFARVGSRILLIDASGVLMELPTSGHKKYSFPVILGTNPGEPLSTRLARMKIYSDLITQLDSSGAHYSQDLSEVDLSDPEDVKVLTNDPQGEVLVHLGSSSYLERYKIYVAHVQEWRQQFQKLESVDLRYDRQIIVNPDLAGAMPQPRLSPAAAKAAMQAGVKPAALITKEGHAVAGKPAAKPLTVAPPKAAAKSSPARPKAAVHTSRWKPARKSKAKRTSKPASHSAASHKAAVHSIKKTKASAKPSPEIKDQGQN
ncbi:MAG TPA: FtsQ-type POTRA domain-containing protein [Terriglobales bacterium]|nr:FtsQ-type POTRA domain-containing protein [Terriglobales bacterium]